MKLVARLRFPAALISVLCLSAPQAAQARLLGVDVSSFQGTGVNWPTAKSGGISFAWAKATEGAGVNDADYVYNMSNGKTAGVIMGSYHYAHPELNTAATEASHFWSRAVTYTKSDGLTLMPMLDIEQQAFSGNVGSTSTSDWINDWCTDIVQDGANNGAVTLTPIIYISECNAYHLDTSVAQWGADIAHYDSNDPQTSSPWSGTGCNSSSYMVWGSGVWNFWQYSSTGGITGYSSDIDKDVYNGTDLSAWTAGQNTNSTIFYWDPQGTTGSNPNTGSMTGTWETSKWSYGPSGLATPVAWVNGKAACFGVHTGIGTPAYTVTMNSSHTVAGFFDGALAPNACDVTIAGTGTINLASGPQALDAKNSSDGASAFLRINVNITGSGQLFPEGTGQSFLHGSNTYSGGFQLGYPGIPFSGTVNFSNSYAFGTGTITLSTNGTGGTVALEGSAAVSITNAVNNDGNCTNNIIGNTAGLTFTGNWDLSKGLLTLGGGATAGKQTIIAGAISGAKGLTIYNSGTIVLSGVNTYTGTTTINSPAVLMIDGSGRLGNGAYANALVDNGTFIYSSTASQTISGVISGTGPVRVADAGTLTLTGANTFSGGTIVSNNGVLAVNADSGLGSSTAGLTLNAGCLKNNNSTPTITSSRTVTINSLGGYVDGGSVAANSLTLSCKLSGAGALLINQDAGAVVLNNTANNYTGNTVIGTNGPGYNASGTQALLKMGTSNVLPKGAGVGSVFINHAWLGALDLNAASQTINGLFGDGTVSNSTGLATLSIGSNNVSSTFNGNIANTAGTLAITKVGTGTLTLAGTNTYNGNTTINSGTLALGATGWIINSPVIVLAAGTTFDVSAIPAFLLSGNSSINANGTASPSTIKGGTTVDLSSRPITLNYDGVHPALTISQGTLALNGNAITVNGSPLADGTYTLIQQTTGNISATGSFTVSGTALGGKPASISIVGGTVNLIVNVAPSITQQPQSQRGDAGTDVTFNVVATGTTPFSYQWRKDGVNISGANSSSYTRASITANDVGSYSVVVTNGAGSVTSDDAVLTLNTCVIALQSIDVTNGINSSLTFSVDPGTTYTLQTKDNLTDATWNSIGQYTSGSSTLTVSDVGVTNTQRFYQLISACASTRPAGFISLSLLGNSDTFVSMPFVRPAAASATVQSASANVLTVTPANNQSWTPNQFVYSSGIQSNNYYVRFASGALNGMMFPVTANDTNTLTLSGGDLSAVVANDLVYVEPYWSLNSIFPNGNGVNISPAAGNRNTEVLIPDLTSSGINLSAAKIYYFNAGIWKQFGQTSVDHGDDIIEPNTHFIVRHNVATNTTLLAAGSVVAADLSIALNVPSGSSTKQDNYIGLLRPVSLSLDASQLISSGAFGSSPFPATRTDELLVFANDIAEKNKSSSAVYYYWSNAWRRVGSGTINVGSDVVFTPGTGVIIRKGTNAPATWTNTPSY